jgi:phenylalanyl-tRNA synthetase beta chain
MLVPLSWLKEYVPLPTDLAALLDRLAAGGLPVVGVKVFGLPVPGGVRVKPQDAGIVWERDKLLVAKVLEITKHPNADTLKLVRLDLGGSEKTVITGAENIAPGQSGMKIVLGLRGSRYFFEGKDGKKAVMTLEPRALRGIDNDAMCMSDYELGVAEDSEGIIILDDTDPAPGTPIQDVLGEVVVELDISPNMARRLSVLGIAREVAALTGAPMKEPKYECPGFVTSAPLIVRAEIADKQFCSRYTLTVIRNVTVGPAPRWMRSRLHYAGFHPVNNVTDITNYVMLETGQPLFAFDCDVLLKRAGGHAPTITVRPARSGEKLKTLDGQERELTPDDLVIADAAGPVALAGVMGGAETQVTAATKNVLLESACFDGACVRKTAQQLNLSNEASRRFGAGAHPALALSAAVRAAQLLTDYAGGVWKDGTTDVYPAPHPPQVIDLDASEIQRLLGAEIPDEEVVRILTALQFQVEPDGDAWTVTTPQTRLDIQGAADLIEELARVYGYDKLPARLMPFELPEQKGNRGLELEERVRDLLAGWGLQEAITHSLTSREAESKFAPGEFVALLNSPSERSVMRRSLLPGLLATAKSNLEHTDRIALFELGAVFLPTPGEQLPDEPRRLAIVLCGRRTVAAWDDAQGPAPQFDFYDLKGAIKSFASDLHLPTVTFAGVQSVSWLHPMRAAELRVNGNAVGYFGELHPKVAASTGFGDSAVQAAELDLDALLAAVPERIAYKPFGTFPVSKRDVAVVVPESTSTEAVLAEIRTAGGDLLTDVALVHIDRGAGPPDGVKCLTFSLTYQAPDRALNDKEIAKAHEKVEGRLKHVLKAQIRVKDAT